MQRFTIAVIVAVAAVAAVAAARAEEPKPSTPLAAKGPLQEAKPQLEAIFRFDLDGPRLKLNRDQWREAPKAAAKLNVAAFNNPSPIEQLFHQIRAAAGIGGTSMTSGGRYRELRFTGKTMSGRVLTRDELVRLNLEEVDEPQRLLEFQDDGQGSWRLLLSAADGDLIYIQQKKQGRCTLTGVIAGKPFATQADSFLALYKQHRAKLDGEILPVFEALSIRLFVPPSNRELMSAVRSMLLRTPALLDEGKQLLTDLDSDRFVARDRASKLLSERYDLYKDLIEAKLKDNSLSIETERRLRKIMAAHVDAQKTSEVITALGLLSNPAFLIELLEDTTPADRGPIAAHLEKTTGQAHGADVTAWKKWLATQR